MKQILSLFLFFIFLSPGQLFAAPTLSIKSNGDTVTAAISGLSLVGNKTYIILVSKNPITDVRGDGLFNQTIGLEGLIPKKSNEAIWNISGLSGNTTYYFRGVEISPGIPVKKTFATAEQAFKTSKTGTITLTDKDATINDIRGGILSGTVNPGKLASPLESGDVVVQVKIFPPNTTKEAMGGATEPLQTITIKPLSPGGSFSSFYAQADLDSGKIYPIELAVIVYGEKALVKIGEINTGEGVATTKANDKVTFNKKSYTLLAPIPGLTAILDPDICNQATEDQICDINVFINFLLKLLIGIAAVILVVKLIIEGYIYMTTDVPFLKAGAKKTFFDALMGLVIALSSYLILNTINPRLVENDININTVVFNVMDYPDAGDDIPDTEFDSGKKTYNTNAAISPATVAAVEKLKNGWEISRFVVFTNDRMLIELKKGSQVDTTNIIDIAHGSNGYAAKGTAKNLDKKTPIGEWEIIDIRYTPGIPQFNKIKSSKTGQVSNMGAAFWHLSPMTSGERGIGMHGNKNGTLSPTAGCIRLKNSDILALQPYVKKGIPVIIK